MTLDGSYDIYEDVQFKEIMEKQRDIASDLKVSLDEVQSSLKKSKVDETLSRLQELKSKIQCEEKEMKEMIKKDIRYTEYYRNEQEIVLIIVMIIMIVPMNIELCMWTYHCENQT